MNVKLYMHSDTELKNIENTHLDSENSTHEGNEELPNGDMHGDSNVERTTMEKRKELVLEKYVRRHHPSDQIIINKEARPMTRNKLRSETCLLSKMEPITEVLQDEDWYNAMKEEIK